MRQIVQEGIEPLLIGEKLLQKIQYKPGMTTVFPAVEPLRADLAGDGMDLPIYNINIGGAQSFAVQVQRHGLGLEIAKWFVDETACLWSTFWTASWTRWGKPFCLSATFGIRYRRFGRSAAGWRFYCILRDSSAGDVVPDRRCPILPSRSLLKLRHLRLVGGWETAPPASITGLSHSRTVHGVGLFVFLCNGFWAWQG